MYDKKKLSEWELKIVMNKGGMSWNVTERDYEGQRCLTVPNQCAINTVTAAVLNINAIII